jgi:hypothetical protein
MDAEVQEHLSHHPSLDPREHQVLVSRALVAERHSNLLESEIKRLEIEIQRLNSNLQHTLCSLHTFESETMRLELENDRLTSRIEEANYVQWHSTDYINAQLANRDDALQRQRIREDGIFCSSCALLRLPDHFFPAMLAPRVPPPRRRCVFCVRAIRENFDCFGRPFFTPPRFTMPCSHPDDSKRLADLHRCYSCASMRHTSMLFPIYDAHVLLDLTLFDSQSRLLAPLSPDAPRASFPNQKFSVCVFCRRDLLRSHSAPSIPPRRQPNAPVPDWEPDPDHPGDCDYQDDSDDLDEAVREPMGLNDADLEDHY